MRNPIADHEAGAAAEYGDAAACLALLRGAGPADEDEAQASLARLVDGLLEAGLPPAAHLEVLEAARGPVALAQAGLARRYAAHPLPPASRDDDTLRRAVALWQTLARSYAHIALNVAAGGLEGRRPLLAQRRLHYHGQALLEYFRAHRAPPPDLWSRVHESFAAAEGQGIASVRVADAQNEVWKAQSVAEAYAAVLLVDLANPFGRTAREFDWVCRWAQRFAPYCRIEADTAARKAAAYGLDLGMDVGLRPLGLLPPGPRLRAFDGSRLAGQIQAVITQFKQGVQPASLGLGPDCAVDECAPLLLSLYRPWGLASAGRRFPRRGCQGRAELCNDWLAIGFHIAGKLFRQPRTNAGRSLRNDIALITLGERVPEAEAADPAAARRREAERLGLGCVRWEVVDQSVGGFRLQQRPDSGRLEHHQLVGILPPDGEAFLLGQVSWLMYRVDGVMEAGVHLLAGLPRRVAARQVGLRTARDPYQQAFLLPATPALKVGPTLVLPTGWFKAHRVMELFDDEAFGADSATAPTSMQVRLGELVLRGTNFDQVNFEPVGSAG